MAILKFDQVTAPDFTGVSSIIKGANNSFNSAGTYANKAIENFLQSRQDMAEYQLRTKLNSLAPEQYTSAGRSFLSNPDNQKYLDRLSLDTYKTLATDANTLRNTLLSKNTSNIYNDLLIEARDKGYTSIPQMLGDTSIRNRFEQLNPEIQKELFGLDKNLINFKTNPDYNPKSEDNSFNVPILQNTSTQTTPASSIISNNVSEVSNQKTSTESELSKYPKDKVDFARRYIEHFGLESPEDLGDPKLLYNKVEFAPYSFEDNQVKFDPETYQIAQKILKNSSKPKSGFDVRTSNTKRYESANSGLSTVNTKDTGGYSYGEFQIHSNTMPAFAQYVLSKDPTLGAILSSLGAWNTEAGEKTWKALANNPKTQNKLKQYQDMFIQKEFYDRPYNALSILEKQALEKDPGLKEAFFDTMNNHGMTRGLPIFREAFKNATTTDDVIKNLGFSRQDRYTSSTPSVRQGAQERIANATQDSLALSTRAPLITTKSTPIIQVSEQTKSGTPKQKNIEVSADTLLDSRTEASKFIEETARNIELKKKSFQRSFEQKFRSLGLSSKILDEAYDANAPAGAEAIEKSVSSIYNILIPKESEKNDPENAEEVRINILKLLTQGQELGIPPKIMEGLILSGSYETNWARQFITGKTTNINADNLAENIKNNLQPLINGLDSYQTNLKTLENSSASTKALVDSIKESRAKVTAAKQKGLTGVVESERRKLNNILGSLDQTFEKPLQDIQSIK